MHISNFTNSLMYFSSNFYCVIFLYMFYCLLWIDHIYLMMIDCLRSWHYLECIIINHVELCVLGKWLFGKQKYFQSVIIIIWLIAVCVLYLYTYCMCVYPLPHLYDNRMTMSFFLLFQSFLSMIQLLFILHYVLLYNDE
jgi:hypothetical protein